MSEETKSKRSASLGQLKTLLDYEKRPFDEETLLEFVGHALSKDLDEEREAAVGTLEKIVLDRALPGLLRCAALDHYVKLQKIKLKEEEKLPWQAIQLIEKIASDWEEPDDLRVVAGQWRRDTRFPPRDHYPRVRGIAPHVSADPSPRLRWLATLRDGEGTER